MEGRICPVCGKPYSWIHRVKSKGRTYIYYAHAERDQATGRRRVRECYAGREITTSSAELKAILIEIAEAVADIIADEVGAQLNAATNIIAKQIAREVAEQIKAQLSTRQQQPPQRDQAGQQDLSTQDLPDFLKDNPWVNVLRSRRPE